MHKAGTQDSGLFFCMSYKPGKLQIVVFVTGLAKIGGTQSPTVTIV